MNGMEQISRDSSVKVREDVISRELEGEAVILNLETGTYFGLNEVGTRIWSLLQEHGSLSKVLDTIQQEYEATPQVLESDLFRLIEELRAKGLVSISRADEGQHGVA
jgi:hypothetical protein